MSKMLTHEELKKKMEDPLIRAIVDQRVLWVEAITNSWPFRFGAPRKKTEKPLPPR